MQDDLVICVERHEWEERIRAADPVSARVSTCELDSIVDTVEQLKGGVVVVGLADAEQTRILQAVSRLKRGEASVLILSFSASDHISLRRVVQVAATVLDGILLDSQPDLREALLDAFAKLAEASTFSRLRATIVQLHPTARHSEIIVREVSTSLGLSRYDQEV